ncbi:MAG TPA: alpha-D-mannose-alpha,1-6-phosphatidyl myo-inositol monomannoside transferase [Porphyromonadaceae bacterium]|nr:alpha-D-mannose-alpha,1-6-phosphatidyl myo-inositol monomannoside transferase [Porphyromonadaceae bacterium]HBX21081.1 alpha-D-mannose-alpha,1-6-phosphatidyl myo-inositol monomannoside transferase [Porphyromonadaceae bacterium]HCM21644.1 alpha-D-mannose-alpha,1-6-phosphatidyl myo-inositol monomannoside transferase [Porphyromonadaceae bacterium]
MIRDPLWDNEYKRMEHLEHKTIKVAFFADILIRDFDGAIKTMYQLIDRIPPEGFEYLFFCGTPPKHSFPHKVVKVPAITIPLNISYKAALPRLAKIRLWFALSKFEPDVIHISTPSPLGFFALDYAKKRGIPVLSVYHTHFISYMRYYFKYVPFLIRPAESLIKKWYLKFYNACTLVYVPTRQIIDELVSFGIEKKRLKLWQRGLDTALFNPSKRDRSFMKKLTGNDYPCILFASRLVWEKNLETLFDIYDLVRAKGWKVNFVIAGNGVAEAEARERMKNAVFTGFIDHRKLATLYASCDVFIFPSISETYGNVVVEAMACGCVPVIARGGGSQSLVDNGQNGFLCEPNRAEDYIIHIQRLLEDEELRRKMQSAGYRSVGDLSWESLANVYFNDLKSLSRFDPPKITDREERLFSSDFSKAEITLK